MTKVKYANIKYRFTLIELMLILAIIAILASLLLPGLGRARQKARTASCLAQLKQAGYGSEMYLLDNDNRYNTVKYQHSDWYNDNIIAKNGNNSFHSKVAFDSQYTHSKELYLCPSATQEDVQRFRDNYTFNNRLSEASLKPNINLKSTRIRKPAELITYTETKSPWLNLNPNNIQVRHEKNSRMTFYWADGHANINKWNTFYNNAKWLRYDENEPGNISWKNDSMFHFSNSE